MRHASEIRTDRLSVRSLDCSAIRRDGERLYVAMALPLRVRQRKGGHRQELSKRQNQILWLQARRSQRLPSSWMEQRRQEADRSSFSLAWHVDDAALFDMAQYAKPLQQSKQSGLPQLRWPGDQGLRRVADEFRSVLSGYEPDVATGTNSRPNRFRRAVFCRELPMGSYVRAMENPPFSWSQARGWQSEQAVSQEQSAA